MRFALFLRRENKNEDVLWLSSWGRTDRGALKVSENSRGSLERCSLRHKRLLFDEESFLKFREPKSSCVNAGRSIRRCLGCHQGLLRIPRR